MSYVQGFVIPVPDGRKADYLALANKAATIFQEYGATQIVEAWGDDVRDGTFTDFKKAVRAQSDETVVFSWIVWPDKATYQAAEAKMMADERVSSENLPFDGKRMIYGGFVPVLEVGS